MPWTVDAHGFHDFTPSLATDPQGIRTKIYYVSRNGDDNTAVVDNPAQPWKYLSSTRRFVVSSANATRGAVYTTDGGTCTFYVADTIAGGTVLYCYRFFGQTPSASGTLTKTSGTGDATITYSEHAERIGAIHQMTLDAGGLYPTYPETTAWVLLEMGMEYRGYSCEPAIGDNFQVIGAAHTEPCLISSWDPSITATRPGWGEYHVPNPVNSALAHPIVQPLAAAGGIGVFVHGLSINTYSTYSSADRTATVGIKMEGVGGTGIWWQQGATHWGLCEDCHSSGSGFGINIQGGGFKINNSVFIDNAGQGIDAGGIPITVYPPDDSDYCVEITNTAIDRTGTYPGDGFLHGLYINGFVDPFLGKHDAGPLLVSNCTIARDTSSGQFRSGGTYYNNSFVKNAFNGVFGNTGVDNNRLNDISYNVITRGWSTSVGNAFGFISMNPVYVSDRTTYGQGTWMHHNLFHKEGVDSDGGIQLSQGAHNWTVENNSFYKYCQANPSNAIVTSGINGGIITHGTITPGSGYTDKTIAINNITIYNASPGPTIIYVTLANLTGWPWDAIEAHHREGMVYIDGIAGALGTVLNGQVHRVYYRQDLGNVIQIQGSFPAASALSYSSGGTVYIPYLARFFKKVTGSGFHFRGDVHVAGGEVVGITYGTDADDPDVQIPAGHIGRFHAVGDELELFGGTSWRFALSPAATTAPSFGDTYTNNGNTYTFWINATGANDDMLFVGGTGTPAASGTLTRTSGSGDATLTFATRSQILDEGSVDVGTIPGGSGFKFAVGEVLTYTVGSNILDTDGTGVLGDGPDPDRTPASYYDWLMNTTGSTDDDYLDARAAMTRQNWEPLLLANSLNDYLRQGVGLPMEGSAYADLFAQDSLQDSRTILLGQAIM